MTDDKYQLCIVAHPDDETIFFGGLLMTSQDLPWKVICVTDGNADGNGPARKSDFENACREMGVSEANMLGFRDIYDVRLPLSEIEKELAKLRTPEAIYTHGPLGEYGHPHHQDVSFVVHSFFQGQCPVHGVAYNYFPDQLVELDKKVYRKKNEILTGIYASEFNRFAHLIPATFCEGFKELDFSEVEELYRFLIHKGKLNRKLIPSFSHLAEHIEEQFSTDPKRIF